MTEQLEPGVVRITITDVYTEMVGMKDDFADVKALLQNHIALEEQRSNSVEQRLENHGTRLADQGTQITSLDGRVTRLESKEAEQEKVATRRATWPQIVGAVTGIIAGGGALIGIFVTLSSIASALATVGN